MTARTRVAGERADVYTFTLADGRTVSGRVQGCGGTLPAGQHDRIQREIDRANEGEALGIYEPRPGHACLKYYNPDGPTGRAVIDLLGAELHTAGDVALSIRYTMRRYSLTREQAERYVLAPDWNEITTALHAWREVHGFPADTSALTRGKLLELIEACEARAIASAP